VVKLLLQRGNTHLRADIGNVIIIDSDVITRFELIFTSGIKTVTVVGSLLAYIFELGGAYLDNASLYLIVESFFFILLSRSDVRNTIF